MAWPPATHQDVQDELGALRVAPPAHAHPVTDLTAIGTRSSTTYLRGDGTWATPATSAALPTTLVHRVIHNGTAYPTRPNVAAGYVEYVGPTQPTTWLTGDTWVERA